MREHCQVWNWRNWINIPQALGCSLVITLENFRYLYE